MIETPALYPVCNVAQRATLRLFADWKVTGSENMPPMGPLLVVANHLSNFDPPLLGASLPRRICFLAKSGLFKGPVTQWFFRSYGAFPLRRDNVDSRAFRWVLDRLKADKAVVIFPEGTRSRMAGMKRAKVGVVRLALKSQAALLPVAITGTEGLGSWARVFNPTGRIRVTIGTPFSIPPIEGRPSEEVLQSMSDMIMQRVADLLPENYQGVYAANKAEEREGVVAS